MLSVQVTGDKAVISGLNSLAGNLPRAVNRGLNRIAIGIHREAVAWLSGPGRTQMKLISRNRTLSNLNRRNTRGQSNSLGARPGAYPVPVITGHLRRMTDWIKPGQSKAGESGVFTAGPNEVVVYNSAAYAAAIHNGKSSSRRYGKRPFLTDAFNRFNAGGKIVKILEEEIQAEILKK